MKKNEIQLPIGVECGRDKRRVDSVFLTFVSIIFQPPSHPPSAAAAAAVRRCSRARSLDAGQFRGTETLFLWRKQDTATEDFIFLKKH